jgi:hypothetical protein
MSHFRTSMLGKMWVFLATMCKYNRRMLGNTWSSNALMSRSLCGIYSRNYSQLILLKRSPHCGSATLDPVLASISPKDADWIEYFFVVVLMTNSGLGAYSNYLMVTREETLPISGSFIFGALGKRLVVGFLTDILYADLDTYL